MTLVTSNVAERRASGCSLICRKAASHQPIMGGWSEYPSAGYTPHW